jgi:adenylate cyclase
MSGDAAERPATRTYAFVDLAGFTALTEAHGDMEALAVVRGFRDRALACLDEPHHLVKTIGDALMFAFPDPRAAVTALQRVLRAELDPSATLLPRAGANHGTAVATGDDYLGSAVNLAARVAGQARGGQLLVTSETALAARDVGLVVTHLGRSRLRNLQEPVDLWEVHLDDGARYAVDPVCAMRVPTTGSQVVSLTWGGHQHWFCGLPCAARFARDPSGFDRPEA